MTYMLVRKGQRFTIAIGGQWICLASRIISELDLEYSHQQFQHLCNQKNWRRFWNWRGWYFCAQKIIDMCQVFIHVLLRIVPCFGVLESFMDYFRTVLLLHLAAWFSSPLFCRCNFKETLSKRLVPSLWPLYGFWKRILGLEQTNPFPRQVKIISCYKINQ